MGLFEFLTSSVQTTAHTIMKNNTLLLQLLLSKMVTKLESLWLTNASI